MRRPAPRALAVALLALALATVLLTRAPGADVPSSGSAGRASAALDLQVRASRGDGGRLTARLRCGKDSRATGYLRARGLRRSCTAARRLAPLLAARPDPGRACTEIYGGPDTAAVSGTVGGRRVDRRFARDDGCAISDWDRAQALLPRPAWRTMGGG